MPGVLQRFSGIVSVDPLRTFKPDPAVYEYLCSPNALAEEKMSG